MKPGGYLLAGVALLGAIATFIDMAADAQAAFLDASGENARGTAPARQLNALATQEAVMGEAADAIAQERPARIPSPPQTERREGGEVASQRMGARSSAGSPASAGNPLWALPLEQFWITRERPLFSPSRRPPPPPPTYVAPVAVRQPVKPPEPERPGISLIGTVIGTNVHIAVFLETKTQTVVRLRLGEAHQGWMLRLVKAREVTLVKDVEQTLVLETPPGEVSALRGPIVSPPVPNSIGTIPVSTASYVDEQPIPVRGARGQRR
jgi:general secretion pathway protein N